MPRKAKSAASKARQRKRSNTDYQNKVKQKESESMDQPGLLSKCCEPPFYANQEDSNCVMLYSDAVKSNHSTETLPVLCTAKKIPSTTCPKFSINMEIAHVPQGKAIKKCETTQKSISTDCSHQSTVSFLPSESRMADVNQSDSIYGDAAGRQCMPTCYIAIAKLKLDEGCGNWSGNTVKELITWGSRMYLQFKPIGHDLFSADDLPKDFIYSNGLNFQQADVQVVAGIIDLSLYSPTENCVYVTNNLIDIFQGPGVSGALLTMNGYTTVTTFCRTRRTRGTCRSIIVPS